MWAMQSHRPLPLAVAGCLAMAAGMGIGRFVYTPILPPMTEALAWGKVDAGIVASANFLGYLIGAMIVGGRLFADNPRRWLVVALAASAVTTAAMGLTDLLQVLMGLRFVSGIASAFVIICASTLVLERLAAAGRAELSAIHFAGVGAGILTSAVIVATLLAEHASWQMMWFASGAAAAIAGAIATLLIAPQPPRSPTDTPAPEAGISAPLAGITVAHGLFGFGYVITATFLVTIVRDTPHLRSLEPWIWIVVGLATLPSVPLWQWLGRRVGLFKAYAVAALVEALGVAASVEWVSLAGITVSALLLGGTFMGLTALGLMCARDLANGRPQRAIGLTTASFGLGQMIGPTAAGYLSEQTGSLRQASLLAAAALLLAAVLTTVVAPRRP